MEVKGEFPLFDFQTSGWVYSTKNTWGAKMVNFVFKELEEPLLQCGLYHAIRAVRYRITSSYYHFFTMLEKYNPGTCTFFTRVGEMGFALHEMLSFGAIHGGPASTSLVLKNCTY